MIEYKLLSADEINTELFRFFIRRQVVTDCVRKVDGKFVVKSDPFIDDWTKEDYDELIRCLKNTARTEGLACGAFYDGKLKGFCSVESQLFGSRLQYLDLSCIHVSEDMRGKGMGRELFKRAVDWAKAHGAEKLYISAHSAVESQAFYHKMGCTEADEYNKQHVEKEPYDCQLECKL